MAAKKKTTTKKATEKRRTPPPSKADVQRALGKSPRTAPNTGRKTPGTKIMIPKFERRVMHLTVRSLAGSSAIFNAWSVKALKEMLENQMVEGGLSKKEKKAKRERKDPFADMLGATYFNSEGLLAAPSVAFKSSMVEACRNIPGVAKKDLLQGMFVEGTEPRFVDLYGFPRCRMDPVRVGPQKVADIRFRPEYEVWVCDLRIVYLPNIIDEASIANLLAWAGATTGIGEWRPERGGIYGQFEIVTSGAAQLKKSLGRFSIDDLTPDNTGTKEILKDIELVYDSYGFDSPYAEGEDDQEVAA